MIDIINSEENLTVNENGFDQIGFIDPEESINPKYRYLYDPVEKIDIEIGPFCTKLLEILENHIVNLGS